MKTYESKDSPEKVKNNKGSRSVTYKESMKGKRQRL